MACLLLWHVKQGTKSALHAWIQTLPRHSNNLVEWSPAQLDELQLGSGSAEADFRAQVHLFCISVYVHPVVHVYAANMF